MFELGNVLNATYSANLAPGVYTSSGPNSAEKILDDESVSVIRSTLYGDQTDQQTKNKYSDESISKAEEIAALAASIEEKMAMMGELAAQAGEDLYSAEAVSGLLDVQANVEPERAFELLREKPLATSRV